MIDEDGLHATQALPGGRQALCIFEHVYFARPDSTLAGAEVHDVRVRMEERLAAEAPVEADLVMPIPDSGTPAAVGYARASGIPQRGPDQEPLRRPHLHRARRPPAVDREVQPARRGRRQAARDRRRLDRALDHAAARRDALRRGAAEVHVRVSSPPIVSPCFYGIDMADEAQLAAAHRSVEQMRELIGATSSTTSRSRRCRRRRGCRSSRSAAPASRRTTRHGAGGAQPRRLRFEPAHR